MRNNSAEKNHARRSAAGYAAALIVFGLLATSWPAAAQTIPLGAAQNFTVLGATTVTNTGATIITGNLGLSPGSSVTGFPPGMVVNGAIHINDALANQAHADAFTAYQQLVGEAPTTNLTGQNLGTLGMALTPGVYHFDTSAQLTGTLRLDTGGNPNAAFHFQIGSTLTTASNSAVVLLGLGGASDPNIFWQVGSSATIGTGTAFNGNILALTSITLVSGANFIDGRALAINGAVTMDTNNVNGVAAPITTGRFWNGNASNLWSGVNWSPDTSGATFTTLNSGADVVFSVTGIVPQNRNTVLDSDVTISSLTVNDPVAVTISGAHTLSISGAGATGGITINNGAGLTTINSALALSGSSQIITVKNAAGLLINGIVSGAIGLTKVGTGRLTLTAAEIYTGSTLITGGILQLGDGIVAGSSIAPSGPVTINNAAALALNLKSGETFGNAVTDNGLVATIASGTNTVSGLMSGMGAFTQNGTGLTILSGANTYSGATTVLQGMLQIGNGLTGSIAAASPVTVAGGTLAIDLVNGGIFSNNVTDNGLVTSIASGTNTLSGVISGTGTFTQNGTGLSIISGANLYTGLTTVLAGALEVDGSIAGNALVSSGILRGVGNIGGNVINNAVVSPGGVASPGRLSFGGNYAQSSSGTLTIRLASTSIYDKLAIGGAATLNGALNVSYLGGFNAVPGNVFQIATAGAGVSGTFSTFFDPHATGTLLTLQVVYEPKDVLLEFVRLPFTSVVPRDDCHVNELAVARALDKLAVKHPANGLIQELVPLPFSQVLGALSLLSPEDLASIFTAGLAVSQIQVGNIEHRLEEVRQGATGFSDSNFAVSDRRVAPNNDGKTIIRPDGKDANEAVAPLVERDKGWGFFISGTGELVDVESTCSARGSSFTTGGVTVGTDYRVSSQFVLGAAIGYANTSSDLNRDGHLNINSGKGSLYGTFYNEGFYLNGIGGGGRSSIDTRRLTVGGFARGETEGTDFNALLGTGYDHHIGALTVGPVASIQYTTIGIDSFSENGSLGGLGIDSQSQDSLKSAISLKAAYTKKAGGIILRPEVRAQWQHEYLTSASSIDAAFNSATSFTVHGPHIGHDGLLLDVGASAQLTSAVAIFAYYSGELGRENYNVHGINGGLSVSF